MGKVCDMDCFHCKFDDCINEKTYREKDMYKNRPEEYRERQRERSKRIYHERKASGLCVICGKKPPKFGVRCYECHLAQKRRDRKKNKGLRDERKMKGLCYYCGAEVIPGKRVCEKHYKILMKCAEKMLNHENTKNARNEQRKWIESFFQ